MSTTGSATPARAVLSAPAALRRNAVLFMIAFGLFVVGVVPAMFGSPDRFLAEEAAAQEAGVAVRDLPGPLLSEIARQHSSAGLEILAGLPVILAMILFAVAIIRSVRGTGRAAAVWTISAMTAAAAFIADMLLYLCLFAEPGSLPVVIANFELLNKGSIAISVMAGCIAVAGLATALRVCGVARRTGVVVIALAALGFVAAPIPAVGGMPPAWPVLLGFVLGVAMLRHGRVGERGVI